MYSSIFLSATIFSWTQALKGQDFPIPKEDLYEDYRSKVTDAECQTPKENSTKVDWRKCMDENDITLDYTCRFSLLSFDCYCCGAFFHYTEHGKICTRYCLKENSRGFCKPVLIVLPNNWGDPIPDKVTLDTGRIRLIKRKDQKDQIKVRKEIEVNVTDFKASKRCPSNPKELDPILGPKQPWSEQGAWNNSAWGSKEQEGINPQIPTTATTTATQALNRFNEQSPVFGSQDNSQQTTTTTTTRASTTTTTRSPNARPIWQKTVAGAPRPRVPPTTEEPVTQRWGDMVWESKAKESSKIILNERIITPSPTTLPTNRFGEKSHSWGGEPTKSDKQNTPDTVGQLVSREKVHQQNVQPRTTRKSPGFGSSIVNLVDSARERTTTIAPTTTTTTTTTTMTSTTTDQKWDWGAGPSVSSTLRTKESEDKFEEGLVWG